MLGDPKKKELKELKKKGLDKTFSDITAPLGKMVEYLEAYNNAQQANEADLEVAKSELQDKIDVSKDEQNSAKAMADKLNVLKDPKKKLVFEDVQEVPAEVKKDDKPKK